MLTAQALRQVLVIPRLLWAKEMTTSYNIVSQLMSFQRLGFHTADLSSCQWTLTAALKYADSGEPHISWSPACMFCSGNLFGCERYPLYYFKHDFV